MTLDKKHGNYNKQSTPKQRLAQRRNWQLGTNRMLKTQLAHMLYGSALTSMERLRLETALSSVCRVLEDYADSNIELGLKK